MRFESESNQPSLLGQVIQSPIQLTQGKREFCNFLVRCSVYIGCPSVLCYNNLKLHQTLGAKNNFKREKIMLQLTFNPWLTLSLAAFEQPGPEVWHLSSVIQSNLWLHPPLLSDQFSTIPNVFSAKSLHWKPLVSDHLSQATATTFRAKILKFSFVFNLS